MHPFVRSSDRGGRGAKAEGKGPDGTLAEAAASGARDTLSGDPLPSERWCATRQLSCDLGCGACDIHRRPFGPTRSTWALTRPSARSPIFSVLFSRRAVLPDQRQSARFEPRRRRSASRTSVAAERRVQKPMRSTCNRLMTPMPPAWRQPHARVRPRTEVQSTGPQLEHGGACTPELRRTSMLRLRFWQKPILEVPAGAHNRRPSSEPEEQNAGIKSNA